MGAVFRRELASYFRSPLGWLVLALFLFVQGYGFYLLLSLLSRPGAPLAEPLELFFGGTLLYWLFLIVVLAVITMRLLAAERSAGQLELLLSAPVSESAIVAGKYLAALCFYVALWLPTGVYVWLVYALSTGPGVDVGAVLAGYLGTFLVGVSGVAIGLMWSSVASNQILSALATFVSLTVLLLAGLLELIVDGPARDVIRLLSLFSQLEQLGRGIVDTRVVMFHLTIAGFCLVAARLSLGARR